MEMKISTLPPSQPEYTPVPLVHSDLEAMNATTIPTNKPPANKPAHALVCETRGTFTDWLKTIQPLAIHFLVTILITVLILFYINGNQFFIDERRPLAKLADGTQAPTDRYIPLQSDITTIVSATIVVLNWATLGWATALYWRSSFLIMEKTGLERRDLEWITGSGVIYPTSYFRYSFLSFIGLLLLITLFPQYSSPLLTGAISWAPSSMLAKFSHDVPMNLSVIGLDPSIGSRFIDSGFLEWVDWYQDVLLIQAAGFSSMAWNQTIEKGAFKRILPSTPQLSIGTIISNVTIPIFWVSNIEWLTDHTEVVSLSSH